MSASKLYTVYRAKDDALIVFEQPAAKAAEIMGVKTSSIYEVLSRQKRGKYKNPIYYIYVTKKGDEENADDE